MSFSVNKVILVGALGADPEVRSTSNGVGIANLRVATSQDWKDKNTGEWKSKTEWHRVTAWGGFSKMAERLHKGSKVYIEGSLQTRKWQDKDGKDQYSTDIVVQGMDAKLIGFDGKNGSNGSGEHQEPAAARSAPRSAPKPSHQDEDDGDSIPF